MIKAHSFEWAFLVPETPLSESHRGWGTGDGGDVVAESLVKSYHLAIGFLFGSIKLSMALGTVTVDIPRMSIADCSPVIKPISQVKCRFVSQPKLNTESRLLPIGRVIVP
jgi:hypothetical protein